MRTFSALALTAAAAATPVAAFAQDAAVDVADTGDTAWILISSALVLMMTMPGLTLFYGGLVRAKNFLAVLVQGGAIAAVASLLWVICGYTLAFGHVTNGWLGAGNAWMLIDLGNVREGLTIPESSFALFQMTFAAITPALMAGALATDNGAALQGVLGRAPDASELYLAHFLGAEGASQFLSTLQANPQTSAASVLPAAARANRAIFFAPGGAARSLGEVMGLLRGKMASAMGEATYPAGATEGWTMPPPGSTAWQAAPQAQPAMQPQTRPSMAETLASTFGGNAPGAPDRVRAAYGKLRAFGL